MTAGEIAEPWWRANDDGAWCFYFVEGRKVCLPPQYELTGFESGHAQWRYWADNGASYLVSYEAESPFDRGEDSLPGDAFLVKSEFGTHSVRVTEKEADLSKLGAHKLSIFVAVFDDKFSLVLIGPDTEGLRILARSLVQQWSATSD